MTVQELIDELMKFTIAAVRALKENDILIWQKCSKVTRCLKLMK